MNIHSKIIIPTTSFSQIIDDEMVILDTQSENYFGLDAMGSVMWQILQQNPSINDLKNALLEQYEVDENILQADIEKFIQQLEQNKLISIG